MKASHMCMCAKVFVQHPNGVGSFYESDIPGLYLQLCKGFKECLGLSEGDGAQDRLAPEQAAAGMERRDG